MDNLDALFDGAESFDSDQAAANVLIIGGKNLFNRITRVTGTGLDEYNLQHVSNLDDAVVLLLQELFGVILIDEDYEDIDSVSVSRVVRTNHPLARIVIVSKKRSSSFIANIINNAAADAFLPLPLPPEGIQSLLAEQQAKHEIAKMLTSFVSQPPKLSKASFLLLDPSLSFADENLPSKFVGIMMIYKSVPRITKFFEDLLAKDEILFAGYLSGVAMLGRELFTTKEPLKEINFGGVSVIFRFIEDQQISIFVRNLTKHNFAKAESKIDEILDQMMAKYEPQIASFDVINDEDWDGIVEFIDKFDKANDTDDLPIIETKRKTNLPSILSFGFDKSKEIKIKNKLEKNPAYSVIATTVRDDATEQLKRGRFGALLLDSKLDIEEDSLSYADYAKEIVPHIQVIYRARDRRASSPIIDALNSGMINFLIPYKSTYKEIEMWVEKALDKAVELEQQSLTGEVGQASDQAAIAKSMIRQNEASYLEEDIPELHGLLIFKEITPVFQKIWKHAGPLMEFDNEMMAGLVASLESVGGEMFAQEGTLGGLELGGANIFVEVMGDYKTAYFVRHVDPNTSVVIDKVLKEGSGEFLSIIGDFEGKLDQASAITKFTEISENLQAKFVMKFGM